MNTQAAASAASDHVESAVFPDVAPFAEWLGLETELAAEGRAVLRLEPRAEMLNRRGVVHGGVLASMLDSAMARACRSVEGVKELAGTTDLHVRYMRPAQGALRVEAWVEHAARTLCFCRAEIRGASDDLLATGTASLKCRR